MRILHSADWHLGKSIHEFSLIEDQKFVLESILEQIEKVIPHVFLVSGDVFDRSVPSAEAVQLLSWFLTEVRQKFPDLVVIIIPGNHDSASRLSFAAQLFESQNIYFRCEYQDLERPISVEIKNEDGIKELADFWAVPFLQGGSLYKQNLEENTEERCSTQESLWEEALTRIHSKMDASKKNILLGHLFTVGGTNCDSERVFVGTASLVSAKIFHKFDYVALGHLHGFQKPSENVVYSGSILPYSFSESKHEKATILIELSEDTVQIQKIPLKILRAMHRLKGSFHDFLSNPKWKKYSTDFLEITLDDSSIIHQAMPLLQQQFPFLLHLIQGQGKKQKSQNQLEEKKHRAGTLEDFRSFYKKIKGEAITSSMEQEVQKALQVLEKEGVK